MKYLLNSLIPLQLFQKGTGVFKVISSADLALLVGLFLLFGRIFYLSG